MELRLTTNRGLGRRFAQKTPSSPSREAREAIEPKAKSFQAMMDEVLPPQSQANLDLNRLWKELPQRERALLEHSSAENLRRYRMLVIQIAHMTLKKNAAIRKTKKLSQDRLTKTELNVVEFIDERLQKMAAVMHSKENSAFALLRALDEIRGMLMDVRQ